jgi:2-polyprenyl-3-methyl-5-hydroxy-6-metoxy-1,4-benzoquinol methylase
MFKQYVELLYKKSERGTDELRQCIAGYGPDYWTWADWFAKGLGKYLEAHQLTPEDGIDLYLKEANDILDRTIDFRRTGRYRDTDPREVLRTHFSQTDKMRQDMVSLALSQFLWPHHQKLFAFFLECLGSRADGLKTYVEIGPGHGLYLAAALRSLPGLEEVWGVDISPFSIEMTRQMLQGLNSPTSARVRLECRDANTLASETTFDFVTVGEVISTSETPGVFLKQLVGLLAPGGRMFLSDCANCPDSSIVHIFHTVEEIRVLLRSCGLEIERECVAPSMGGVSEADHARHRLSVSYAALLRRVAP